MKGCLATLTCLLLGVASAQADTLTPVAVRLGDHPGFSRVVIDADHSEALDIAQQGDLLVVTVPGADPRKQGKLPQNVADVTCSENVVRITMKPGTSFKRSLVNHHLVLDILDPSAKPEAPKPVAPKPVAKPEAAKIEVPKPEGEKLEAPKPGASKPEASKPEASKPEASKSEVSKPEVSKLGPKPLPAQSALVSKPAQSAKPQAALATPVAVAPSAPPQLVSPEPTLVLAPQFPAPPVTDPAATSANLAAAPEARPGHTLALPFTAQVGAAAFRRGSEAIVVFDERKPIDLQNVAKDPVFGQARVQLLPAATLLYVKLPANTELRLERRKEGWMVTAIGGDAMPAALQGITPEFGLDHVMMPAQQASMVVSVPDSLTGGVLLVGTQRSAGQGVLVARTSPDFAVLPSWQGVVLAPVSDALVMRARAKGFEISTEGNDTRLASSIPDSNADAAADASRMTRSFDLPPLRTASLIRRLQGATASAAEAPPQSKAEARRGVAEAMVALGMGAEAQAVLSLATTDDARAADDLKARGLSALASLLAGRPGEAAALDDRALDGSDEINFWRAVRQAMSHEGDPAAASIFANTLPLLNDYPAELRNRVLPLVVETLISQGDDKTLLAAAKSLLARFQDAPGLGLARAMLAEKSGETDAALAAYDALANGSDRLVRLRAARAAAELRLASGKATASETAAKLGKMLFAWRGDGRELELRQRVADLLAQAQQWRPALQLLRETEAGWPDQAADTRAKLRTTFAAAIRPDGQASLKPFDMVALAEENADLMPDGEQGQALAGAVSDQLIALDLPDRAIALLSKMLLSAPRGAARAAFGERLAGLQLAQGDAKAAIDALTRSSADSLPAPLLEARGIDFASAVASQGDFPSARQALLQLDSEAADRKLTELAEAAKLWPDAETGWRRLATRLLPATGMMSEDQAQILLRLASAAAEAHDDPVLEQLRRDITPRMPKGKTADLFALITTQKITSNADLGAVTRDANIAKSAGL